MGVYVHKSILELDLKNREKLVFAYLLSLKLKKINLSNKEIALACLLYTSPSPRD